jgi:hypothetical protein
MGACKKCKEVFGVLEMNDGVCKGCMSEDELKDFEAIKKTTPKIKEEKKKSTRIINLIYWGNLVFLGIIVIPIHIVFIGAYLGNTNSISFDNLHLFLLTVIVPFSIYTGYMALIGMFKKLNTPNKIWVTSTVIIIIIILLVSYGMFKYNSDLEIIILVLTPFLILSKLAFLLADKSWKYKSVLAITCLTLYIALVQLIVSLENMKKIEERKIEAKLKALSPLMRPTSKVCTENGGIVNSMNECKSRWAKANIICKASGGKLASIHELKAMVLDCGGNIDENAKNYNNENYKDCLDGKYLKGSPWSSTSNKLLSFFSGEVFLSYNNNDVQCIRNVEGK